MKKCNKCGMEKNLADMAIHNIKDDKICYRNVCIICYKVYKKYDRNYYLKNKESQNIASKKWTIKNKEKKRELNKKRNTPENKIKYLIAKNKWRELNKGKEKEYQMVRYQKRTNLEKLKNNIRNSIRLYLKNKGFIKTSKTEIILGCSFIELVAYLESKFENWMTWENWGKFNGELNNGWDIDHIVPLCTAINEEEVLKLSHYTNLQPLCSKVNRHIKRGNIKWQSFKEIN